MSIEILREIYGDERVDEDVAIRMFQSSHIDESKFDMTNTAVLNCMSVCYLVKHRDLKKALNTIRESDYLDSDNPTTQYIYGLVLLNIHAPNAMKYFRKAKNQGHTEAGKMVEKLAPDEKEFYGLVQML